MTNFYSSAPIHQVTDESFLELVPGEGDKVEHRFTRQVHWLVETDVKLLYVHGGRTVARGEANHNLRPGLIIAVKDALYEAEEQAQECSITKESSLTLLVRVEIKARPVLWLSHIEPEGQGNPSGKLYMPIPESWLQDRGVYDEIPQYAQLNREKQVLLMDNIWSTQKSEAENESYTNEFFKRWEHLK
jgi:hypothetical protein